MMSKLAILFATSAMAVGLSGMPAPAAQHQNQSQASQPNVCNAVLTDDKVVPESTLADLRKMPNITLQTFPNGGPLMVDFVARAVVSDFSLLQAFLGIVGEANALQRSAIGTALARAASLCSRGGFGDNAQAIAEAIVANGDQRLANAFAATTPGEGPGAIDCTITGQCAAPGAVAGAAPGAVGGGPVGTSTGLGVSNAVPEGAGSTARGSIVTTGGGVTAGGVSVGGGGPLSTSPSFPPPFFP